MINMNINLKKCVRCQKILPATDIFFRKQAGKFLRQCIVCLREMARNYTKQNTKRYKGHILKSRYGITMDIYETMHNSQKGICKICGKHQDDFKRLFAVDHDHKTGRIRGLLCPTCNTKLGWYENNIEKIKEYMRLKK